MDWLHIPKMDSAEPQDQADMKMSAEMLNAFVKQRPKMQEFIKDYPVDEGFSETAKGDAVYSIVREFLIWVYCLPKPDKTNYNIPLLHPTQHAAEVQSADETA